MLINARRSQELPAWNSPNVKPSSHALRPHVKQRGRTVLVQGVAGGVGYARCELRTAPELAIAIVRSSWDESTARWAGAHHGLRIVDD